MSKKKARQPAKNVRGSKQAVVAAAERKVAVALERKTEAMDKKALKRQRKQKWCHEYMPGGSPAQRQRLTKWLESNSLVWVNIVGDGNCLFRALSHQMYGHQDAHREIRGEIVDYIQSQSEHFSAFLDEEDGSIEDYCSRMRQETSWGGHLEIQAFSLMKGVNVLIHQSSLVSLEFVNWPSSFPCVQLIYEEGEHYSSIYIQESVLNKLLLNREEIQWTAESKKYKLNPEWVMLRDQLMTTEEIRQLSTWSEREGAEKPEQQVDEAGHVEVDDSDLLDVLQPDTFHAEVTETELPGQLEDVKQTDQSVMPLIDVADIPLPVPLVSGSKQSLDNSPKASSMKETASSDCLLESGSEVLSFTEDRCELLGAPLKVDFGLEETEEPQVEIETPKPKPKKQPIKKRQTKRERKRRQQQVKTEHPR
eukprot:Blabericola_migrator_1__8304@NODE_430_length_8568_cov_132_492766_g339_i0_p3_GENE_NODE_430_length_8568_cov_132_492766_g339_i0NODE_430_length_8568_cov_132_492766_g339_i0_p3_ORF_typecomplete_len421_score94_38OTU/PF02338_19/3_6e27OTU/PF02338_19/6e02Peptidase_C65/PF10275_9/0_096Peptidase_C65/PF10275_9/0_0016XRN1_D2_D3/PF18334_1/2_6XRN1_D2_D3/PF18334_1/3_8e02_NODE_430_length_8568_cov_132_492766_g339_i071578419